MILIQRLIYKQILLYAFYLSLAIILLFVFFIVPDELSGVDGSSSYTMVNAIIYSILSSLVNLQDILPIASLIAAVFVLSKMAINSEFTVLRTSGLGPLTTIKFLFILGLIFSVLTFAFANYFSPAVENFAEEYKLKSKGLTQLNAKNLIWLRANTADINHIVNIKTIDLEDKIHDVNIYNFDKQGFLVSQVYAQQASVEDGYWLLNQAQITTFPIIDADSQYRIEQHSADTYTWKTALTLSLVKSSFTAPDKMSVLALHQFTRYLNDNQQDPQRYKIAFWAKIFSSLSNVVMLLLALPFAYLHFRHSNVYFYVFIGIILGLSFFVINTMMQHLTQIRHWTPWLAMITPSLIYSIISLIMANWLIRNR